MSNVVTTRNAWIQNLAKGKGATLPMYSTTPATVTAGAAASGLFTASFAQNALGTNQTFYIVPVSPGSELRLTSWTCANAQTRCLILARLYLIGTQNLVGTGDKFTHDSATFPVTRTQFGSSSQAVTLIPMIEVTQAPNTSAPVMRLRTVAGAAGYTDQDGNSTIATLTVTLPSATTAVGSCYIWRLEDQDSGVQNISNIENTTGAASTGTANIWGMEILAIMPNNFTTASNVYDALFGMLSPTDLKPAVATSGTVTSRLVVVHVGTTTGALCAGHLTAVHDA